MTRSSRFILLLAFCCSGATYYVAPDGSAENSGTIESPWPLYFAVTNTTGITAGDTVYLRGGTYSEFMPSDNAQIPLKLSGTAESRVTIESYPGEWAVIRATNSTYNDTWNIIGQSGQFVDIKNFEICSTKTTDYAYLPAAVYTAPTSKEINISGLVIHDVAFGIAIWRQSTNSTVSDCLIYNCGSANTDHSVYSQNETGGIKTFARNFMWGPSSINLHFYTGGGAPLWGFRVQTNILACSGRVTDQPSVLVGGSPATNLVVEYNYLYENTQSNVKIDHAHTSTTTYGQDGVFANNYSVNRAGYLVLSAQRWHNLFVTNNTFIGKDFVRVNVDEPFSFAENTIDHNAYVLLTGASPRWYTNSYQYASSIAEWASFTGYDLSSTSTVSSAPENKLAVIPLAKAGEAWLVGYNHNASDNLEFDVSSVAQVGGLFTVKDGFNFAGQTIASGIYAGGTITLPATNLVAATASVGGSLEHPAPYFVVFKLTSGAPRHTHTIGSATIGSGSIQ